MNQKLRISIIVIFAFLSIGSAYYTTKLNFTFSFEQFFPKDDPELDFFRDFVKDFNSDDSFLLVAIENKPTVFDTSFLNRFHEFCLKAKSLPFVLTTESITQFNYPIKTPFTVSSQPALNRNDPEKLKENRSRVLSDERMVNYLISKKGDAVNLVLNVVDDIDLNESAELLDGLDLLVKEFGFLDYHYMGRSYFQREMVRMQVREVLFSTIFASIIVIIVMFLLLRRPIGIVIALISIGLGMLLFLGFLGVTTKELNAMVGLYPILMIIVGTSDVIHIMTKYIDELYKGKSKKEAISLTVREIGFATFLTSITTAIGFLSLLSSRIEPIRDFGINASIGVLIAYVTVITLTLALLSFFDANQLMKKGKQYEFWKRWMTKIYVFSKLKQRNIVLFMLPILLICFWGISKISTNYHIESNLPTNAKVTEDYFFFEREFVGFRPLEIAITAKNDKTFDDFDLMKDVDKLSEHLKTYPDIKAVASQAIVYKSINQMLNGNKVDAYQFPKSELQFKTQQVFLEAVPSARKNIFITPDKDKTRISSKVNDLGADSVTMLCDDIYAWIDNNLDTTSADFRLTGTTLILDKNVEYVRENLIKGLGLAVILVSIFMALLFRNVHLILISLVPNLLPLIIAAAILGFYGIELEAGITIIFAIVFGIAVDDTIHFLSKYKIAYQKTKDIEIALKETFVETGKAICLTSIILFFGFMVLQFSIHPPSRSIGTMIGVTLFTAVVCDLLIIPVLIRRFLK